MRRLKIIATLNLAVLCFSVTAFAEPAPLANERANNLWSSPILLLAGAPNVTWDIRLKDNWSQWTLGPSFVYFAASDGFVSASITGLGACFTRHFGGAPMDDSWYLGGSLFLFRANASVFGFGANAVGALPGIAGGYQWAWDHFNLRLGLGIALNSAGLDFGLGYIF